MHLNRVEILADAFPTDEYYPFNLPLLQRTGAVVFDSPVTYFVGENGSGKTTLLEALAFGARIHIWRPNDTTRCEFNPYEDLLYQFIRLDWANGPLPGSFFAADIFKNFAKNLDEWAATDPGQLRYFGGRSLMTQSHGQSLMSFFRSRYTVPGLYLLDEPETALSPRSQLELLRIVSEMGAAGHAQFIISTHSPLLLACPGASILSFDQAPPERIDYRETEHFRVYRDFLNDPGRYL